MNKNFKIVALVIIAFGALLFVRERKLQRAEKEMSRQYADKKALEKKSAENKFAANEQKILKNETAINSCLEKVKAVQLKMVQDENDIIVESITAISNGKKDSAEKVSGGEKDILNKLNRQNTIVVYYNKLQNQQLNLVQEIKQLLSDNSVYSSKLNTYTDIETTQKDIALSRAAAVEYIVVAQPQKIKKGKITGEKQFDAGYMVLQYDVFNINNSTKIKSSTVLATNSESLYGLNSSDMDLMVYQDLLRQGNKAITKTVFGTTNNL